MLGPAANAADAPRGAVSGTPAADPRSRRTARVRQRRGHRSGRAIGGPIAKRYRDSRVSATAVPAGIPSHLDSGRVRAAHPGPDAPGGWRVDSAVQAAILGL